MLAKRMSAREARANFSDLLGQVYYTKEPVVVEKNGRPFAVVISPEQYEVLQREQERAWMTLERVQESNAEEDPDAVYQDVTAVVEEVRQDRYEKEKKAPKRRR